MIHLLIPANYTAERPCCQDRLTLPDAAIAASAELTGCTLLTRNVRDLKAGAEMLSVEFYSNER
jgi:predicted nucleic acid-binding protein